MCFTVDNVHDSATISADSSAVSVVGFVVRHCSNCNFTLVLALTHHDCTPAGSEGDALQRMAQAVRPISGDVNCSVHTSMDAFSRFLIAFRKISVGVTVAFMKDLSSVSCPLCCGKQLMDLLLQLRYRRFQDSCQHLCCLWSLGRPSSLLLLHIGCVHFCRRFLVDLQLHHAEVAFCLRPLFLTLHQLCSRFDHSRLRSPHRFLCCLRCSLGSVDSFLLFLRGDSRVWLVGHPSSWFV